ncbi:hypothetical protein FI667_g6491, partial [Globisporangium splendens]
MLLPWIFAVLAVVFAVLYVSPKLRKSAFIWFTYITLTGWYYFRLWEKKRARAASTSSPRSSTAKKLHSESQRGSSFSPASMEKSRATSRHSSARYEEDDIEDVVYFESAEKIQQQRELRSVSERSSGRGSESSSSGNSGYSEDTSSGRFSFRRSKVQQQPKSHSGIFRSLRKSHREDTDKRRNSEFDPLISSSVSEPAMTTRRTYTGLAEEAKARAQTSAGSRQKSSTMFGFNVNKLKPNLKMAVHRIGIVKNKKANAGIAVRREIATLLADGKEEKARIRVEGIIRDDFTVEGYEILELLCELVAERANRDPRARRGTHDDVATHVHALLVKKQLIKKYGQDFAAAATRNVDGCVNERVIQKLSVQPPSAYLVVNYMKEIAKQFKVDWEPDEQAVIDPLAPIPAPTGASVVSAGASGPSFAALYATAPPPPPPPKIVPTVPMTTDIPSDSAAFRVRPPSASSRYFAPPPAPTAPPAAPPAYHESQQHQSQYAPTKQHDSSYHNQPPPPQQQPPQPHHHQQSSPYVPPHAAATFNNSTQAPASYAAAPSTPAAPSASTSSAAGDSNIPDFDELTARFERLRKRQDQDSTSFTF